mgnify:CR=1 FL=1
MVDSAEPANTVVQVFQKGYLLDDRVLRPGDGRRGEANDGDGAKRGTSAADRALIRRPKTPSLVTGINHRHRR